MEVKLSAGESGLRISEHGVAICHTDADADSWAIPAPARLDLFAGNGQTVWVDGAYSSVECSADGGHVVARAELEPAPGIVVVFEDRWSVDGEGGAFVLAREVRVDTGSADTAPPPHSGPLGFLTAFELATTEPCSERDVEPFIPATMYGDNGALPVYAVGSRALAATGSPDRLLREDRLPAPLVAIRRRDGRSLALVHVDPDGRSTWRDVSDFEGSSFIDDGCLVGSLGLREEGDRLRLAFRFPASEGSAISTSHGESGRRTTPNRWRSRYHSLVPGAVQRYALVVAPFRVESAPVLVRRAWRLAFDLLDPAPARHDIGAVERAIGSHLSDHVDELPNGAAGVRFLRDSVTDVEEEFYFGLGFCGRNEQVAWHLLRLGHRYGNERYLEQGRRILDFWTTRTGPGFTRAAYHAERDAFGGQDWYRHRRANVPDPPEGEAVSIRELVEGHLGCLQAWREERSREVDHPRWLAWCTTFADWLLSQQDRAGLFPRWWTLGGDVLDPSTTGSFNAIPFLCELGGIVDRTDLVDAARRAGETLWNGSHRCGVFVGGTVDNPDVLDKEAATISLEAYLALYAATEEERWLDAATVAADVAETWLYLWNLPMVVADDPLPPEWGEGATSVGLSAVAVGGSGADQYLAWNVDEFARLGELTGDEHYLRVAELCLHNTKTMLSLPDRLFDFAGPGWQQEHWAVAMRRGHGARRWWLPWVTVCHLAGMAKLEDRNPGLYARLAGERTPPEGEKEKR